MSAQSSHMPKGPVSRFESQTPYEIQAEDRDNILRISAYHRRDTALEFISFLAGAHTDVLKSILTTDSKPTAALGELDRLPLELVHNICLETDMESLFHFRQINTRRRQTVGVLHEYRIITTHALNAFCALLRIGAAPNVTLLDFYRLFFTQNCSVCKANYGNLVHLLLWIRCCSFCVTIRPTELRVSTLNSVKRFLKLSETSLAELPKLTTLPGAYGRDQNRRAMRMAVVSNASVSAAYRKQHSGVEAPQNKITKLNTQWIFLFMACCAFPSFDWRTRQAQHGVFCAGCEVTMEEDTNPSVFWKRCIYPTVYSHDDFLKHFERCKQTQLLWTSSNGGTRQPPKLPYICQRGGFLSGG